MKKILVSKDIDADEMHKYVQLGYEKIEILPCIKTRALALTTDLSFSENIVFTSHTAIDIFLLNVNDSSKFESTFFFVLSTKAAKKLQHISSKIYISEKENAESILELLIKHNIKKANFICGITRLSFLEIESKKKGILLNIIEAYETILLNPLHNESYDAIAFYSPSAFYSFTKKNTILPNATIFVKGKTTLNAIQNIENNIQIIV